MLAHELPAHMAEYLLTCLLLPPLVGSCCPAPCLKAKVQMTNIVEVGKQGPSLQYLLIGKQCFFFAKIIVRNSHMKISMLKVKKYYFP